MFQSLRVVPGGRALVRCLPTGRFSQIDLSCGIVPSGLSVGAFFHRMPGLIYLALLCFVFCS